MDVLYLSRSTSGQPHPFIKEQALVLSKNFNISIHHFLINQGGGFGYIKAIIKLASFLNKNNVDIIHVHYGLWGLVAIISKLINLKNQKIIITYHGSDINNPSERKFSLIASQFSSHNILVSEKMLKHISSNCSVIPCGIDTNVKLSYREETRAKYGWSDDTFVILFSSNFKRKEKDPAFAFKVIDALSKESSEKIIFLELKGYSREELTQLMQAADALLMCSLMEGSPQVVKEAIVNSLPVVTNDVGDVKSICADVDNCFILPKKVEDYKECLLYLAKQKVRIQNRYSVIEKFDNDMISHKLFTIYQQALCKTLQNN
jgi:glycosyltransferase involved in cell wall biosynthesis